MLCRLALRQHWWLSSCVGVWQKLTNDVNQVLLWLRKQLPWSTAHPVLSVSFPLPSLRVTKWDELRTEGHRWQAGCCSVHNWASLYWRGYCFSSKPGVSALGRCFWCVLFWDLAISSMAWHSKDRLAKRIEDWDALFVTKQSQQHGHLTDDHYILVGTRTGTRKTCRKNKALFPKPWSGMLILSETTFRQ